MSTHYWKQTNWNEYTLTSDSGESKTFSTYSALVQWCKAYGIDARQV